MNRANSLLLSVTLLAITQLPGDAFHLKRGPAIEQSKGKSGALEALDFWTQSRAYPSTDISPDKHFRAFEYVRLHARRAEETLLLGGSSWTFMGPTNFSGRMISVEFNPNNPNTLYAGAASGGLWRSYTAGIAGDWNRISTGYPVLGVNAIAIDPADTNTMYIGTGETYRYGGSVGGMVVRTTRGSYGMGILKTTDGGLTWTKSLDWSYNQERGVQALRFNPLNTHTIFAATSEGVYRSSNAGATWDPVLEVLMARDFAVHPQDTLNILVTCGNFSSPGAGVYRSTDGGLSFSQIVGLPSFSGMAVLGMFPAQPDTVFLQLSDSTITVGSLWKTENFGDSWTLIHTDNSGDVQGWYARFLAVHPQDPQQIVRGAQGLSKSVNGGTTFSGVFDCWADYHSYAYHPTNPNTLYIVDDGGVWRSTDFGSNYTFVGTGLETSQFYNGFSSSANDSLIALGQVQDHFGYMYTGSKIWPDGGVDEVGWTAINQTYDGVMYAGDRGGGSIYKSVNRGNSFFWSGSGISGGISCWNAPFIISYSDPAVLYFGRSMIFKTTNAANNWTATSGGAEPDGNPALSMAMSFTGTDTVYFGTAPRLTRSHLFRTTDGGGSWADITGPLPNRYPLDLAVDPDDPSVVYVAFGGFDTAHVFKSVDAGGTWLDVSGDLPDVPATALVVDPLNSATVYLGTDIGVFVSTNGGGEWMTWNDGLPEAVIVSDLSISRSNRAMRVATHSNGVYERAMLPPGPTAVGEEMEPLPLGYDLAQNYPNPFNPSTTISYTVPGTEHVTVRIVDINGRTVTVLLDDIVQRGTHSVLFDARGLASGTYYYSFKTGNVAATKKMLLLR